MSKTVMVACLCAVVAVEAILRAALLVLMTALMIPLIVALDDVTITDLLRPASAGILADLVSGRRQRDEEAKWLAGRLEELREVERLRRDLGM
jgi:hypothetical protein